MQAQVATRVGDRPAAVVDLGRRQMTVVGLDHLAPRSAAVQSEDESALVVSPNEYSILLR